MVREEQFCKLRAVRRLFRRRKKRQYLGQWRAVQHLRQWGMDCGPGLLLGPCQALLHCSFT